MLLEAYSRTSRPLPGGRRDPRGDLRLRNANLREHASAQRRSPGGGFSIEKDQEREEGHAKTRNQNFECDNPDKTLGCDPGIDVQG